MILFFVNARAELSRSLIAPRGANRFLCAKERPPSPRQTSPLIEICNVVGIALLWVPLGLQKASYFHMLAFGPKYKIYLYNMSLYIVLTIHYMYYGTILSLYIASIFI